MQIEKNNVIYKIENFLCFFMSISFCYMFVY